MIRLLHILTTLDVGGAEAQVLAVLSRLPRDRFEVTVAWLKGRGELAPAFEAAGLSTVNLRMLHALDPGVMQRALRLVRELRPLMVHTHLMKADFVGGCAARLARVPVLLSTKHNEDPYLDLPPVAAVARGVAELADRVIVISDAVGRFVSRRLRIPAGRMERIHYGHPAPNGSPPPARTRHPAWWDLGVAPGTRLVTMVGRLTRQKGLFDLIRAASLLRDAAPEARFLLVGRGELRAKLGAAARDLDLTDTVRFLGFRRDIDRVLAASDLLVLPSHWEGFGLVLLEAMAAGLPVVGTRVGAIPEVVADGETGLLVPPRDPDALATAVLRILRDPERAARMGAAGRRRLETVFSMDRAVAAHVELYELLARDCRGR